MSKRNRIIAWVLTILAAAMPLMSSVMKFMRTEDIVNNFTKWDLLDQMTLIGAGELVAAILFIIPQTRKFGMLLLTATMGGAISTHMANNESYMMPAIILVLVWIAGMFSHAEFYGFSKKN